MILQSPTRSTTENGLALTKTRQAMLLSVSELPNSLDQVGTEIVVYIKPAVCPVIDVNIPIPTLAIRATEWVAQVSVTFVPVAGPQSMILAPNNVVVVPQRLGM